MTEFLSSGFVGVAAGPPVAGVAAGPPVAGVPAGAGGGGVASAVTCSSLVLFAEGGTPAFPSPGLLFPAVGPDLRSFSLRRRSSAILVCSARVSSEDSGSDGKSF